MSTIEAEQLYERWVRDNGPLTRLTVVDLISWVLATERRHETAGHRQTVLTDEAYLQQLGYVHTRDGWHLPSSE